MPSCADRRVILFLQGPPSVFWAELAATFEERGARTLRVALSTADHLFWRRPGTISYRGGLSAWPAYLEGLIGRENVTDIVYYADRPPYHAAAARVAARLGIRCHAVENGYLRPDWITLERGGMGAYSHFPTDPATIRRIARDLPEPDLRVLYGHGFFELAVHEVANDLVNFFGRLLYPGYRADRYYNPVVDYLSWFPRLLHIGKLQAAAAEVEQWDPSVRFWLLAMQLQADYQIRENSHYGHLSEMLEEVLASFAVRARPEDRLVVKLHPHDNGLERWDRVIADLSRRFDLGDRIHLIDGGNLGHLLDRCQGAVLVNSTVGLHALRASKPLKVLGSAVYDIPGLTHQGPLETFWTSPEAVDAELAEDFVRALAATIQVKGDFYDPAGRRVAAAEIAARVLEHRVNEPGAFVPKPPRLEAHEARRRGDSPAGEADPSFRPPQPAGRA